LRLRRERHRSLSGEDISDLTVMRALKPVLLCLAAVTAFMAAGFVQVVTAPTAPMPTIVVAVW